jgi:hypothetical protein
MEAPKKKVRTSFFEKKEAKKLCPASRGFETGNGPDSKSFFCFFFVHKKEDSCFPNAPVSDARLPCWVRGIAPG